MSKHVITKGLDLPISGTPEPKIDESKAVRKSRNYCQRLYRYASHF
jgi:Na+-transporting NADH:ubiquinone oxidoreductase subunit NqrA